MHIFVTGGSGFIGKNLIPYLLERECQVTCLLRDPLRLPEELRRRVRMVIGDLTGLTEKVEAALGQSDAVVHLAGRLWGRTYQDYERVNRGGTAALVSALNRNRSPGFRRFVYLSSLSASGPSEPGKPHTEEHIPRPVSKYGRSKLAGEKTLDSADFPWTILRPPTVYGPYDPATLIFFRLASRHLSLLPRRGTAELSIVHARDVCQAIWLALTVEQQPRSVYFLNDGQAIRDAATLMALVARAVGTWTRSLPLPGWLLLAATGVISAAHALGLTGEMINPDKIKELRQRAWTCEAGRIERQLGYRATVPLEEGLQETAAWYHRTGWL